MCGKNFTFWYCLLLFVVASSSKSQQYFMINEEKNDNFSIRYELDANSTTNYKDEMNILRYDLYEKPTNNTENDEHRISFTSNENDDSIQHELRTRFLEKDDDHIELRTNLRRVNNEKNFTSRKVYRDLMRIEGKIDSTLHETSNGDDNKFNIVSHEMCVNNICIPLCCPPDNCLVDEKCILQKNKTLSSFFPNVYENTENLLQKRINELFHLVVHDPCRKIHSNSSLDLNSSDHSKYKYMFFTNGSLYLPEYHVFVESKSYCLARMSENMFDIIICSETVNEKRKSMENIITYKTIIFNSMRMVSALLLLATFLVYSIVPELRNTHGFMLRSYCGMTIIVHIFKITGNLIEKKDLTSFSCVTIACVQYFFILASYFWLSIMSFDMWWKFKNLRSLKRKVKQEKKKLIIYSIYAWGFPFILAIFCGIINLVLDVPKNLRLMSNFSGSCLFRGFMMFMLFFYVPKSLCVIISVCLSIFTALKIQSYEKNTAHHLQDLESRCYNENKKWFNMCLKLFIITFIMMGIRWFTVTGNLLYKSLYQINYRDVKRSITHSMDIILNLSILIIFVCKKTIKQLLLKQFCQKTDTTFSRSCTTTSGVISKQETIRSCKKTNSLPLHSSDVTKF
ncbi:G-protein coupled receptor Mth2-like [Anoplolepis gracilipes]|uniref:G-protein coupled receptor Mth2-like n=1 Tax=Anoplolepis gracilipes TaxID=354296 RepID=UPI003BA34797